MDATELCYISAAQLSRLIKEKKLSPVEVVEAHLARIDALEPTLNSFITLMPEQAMAAARVAEKEVQSGGYRGPLHGVPLGLKDLYYVKGVRNTSGSRVFDDFIPELDCTIAARFKQAGAILLGKLNMHPLAYGPKPGLRKHAQPLEPGADIRRLQRGLRFGRRCRPVYPDNGYRYRRVNPHPQRPVLSERTQAHLWPPQSFWHYPSLLGSRPSGAHGPDRGGLCSCA